MKSKTSMVEYCKAVLKALAFDRSLQRKEFLKSRKWLTGNEVNELKEWFRTQEILERGEHQISISDKYLVQNSK